MCIERKITFKISYSFNTGSDSYNTTSMYYRWTVTVMIIYFMFSLIKCAFCVIICTTGQKWNPYKNKDNRSVQIINSTRRKYLNDNLRLTVLLQ